jgi:hypothetical protein
MTRMDAVDAIRLLVRLLRSDAQAIERRLQERPDALEELSAVATDRGLAVVLLRALEASPWAGRISVERRRVLSERRERQAARCVALERGLAQLSDVLGRAGVPFMLLKGPYLAARFYSNPRGREYRDLDLLVRRADRSRAFGLIEQAGYERRSRVLVSEELTAFFVHGFDFVAGDVNLDLHWCLARHPSVRIDEGELWKRKDTFRLGDRAFGVLSDAHEVTLQALALVRDIERGRPQMKNVVDLIQIVAALDAGMPWDALFAASRSEGTHGALVNVLALCLDIAAARDVAPRLAAALGRSADRRVRSITPVFAQESSSAAVPRNRLWAARSYDTSLATCLAWWAISLPFRRAAHGWPRPPATVRSPA